MVRSSHYGVCFVIMQGISDKRLRAYIALQGAYGMEYLHLHYMVCGGPAL